ncbi:hypothetical protein [Lysinibacillus sp. NPDC086135]|uniref:hypothetical protein n=1 Tax=Lysinibacillus sp. NPDC086135 TaxID=3364130 RepID=UPI0037F78520
MLNMPIVTKFNGTDFGTHEYTESVVNGKKVIDRDTVPIGVFTSEGYVDDVVIEGENKRVLIADGLLWYTRFTDACDLLLSWNDNGMKINMSCEYRYKNHQEIDGITYHLAPLLFEGHCILGSNIRPAYESATFVDTSQFNLLVAQAMSQENKEDNILTEEEKLQNEEQETQTQLNELSHDEIRNQIREQVKSTISANEWAWVNSVYETYAIVEIETDAGWDNYRFDYSIENDSVTVNLESKVEVKEKREWVVVTNELQEELNKVRSQKDQLASKFSEATDTIISLNSTIDQLKPYQEQMLNSLREAKVTEQKEVYEVKFNAVNASDTFKSDEVQNLIMNSIEDTDEGKDALLQLNKILFDSIKVEEVKIQTNAIAGIASKREFNNVVKQDDFNSKYKY